MAVDQAGRYRWNRIALLVGALVVSNAFAAPLAGAVNPSIFSGAKPLDPINVDWAKVNGVPTTGNGAPVSPVQLEFLVKNQPKSLTFNGVNSVLAPGDEVLVVDFAGQYDISGGNIKFSGTAASWEICNRDRDGDGLANCAERYTHGTNPDDPDTDHDGLTDGAEVATYGTNPKNPDTDADGLKDGAEVLVHGTDPKDRDTDDDGLNDGPEVLTHRTDPKNADTDGDGLPDKWEVQNGTDPLTPDASADPDGDGLTNAGEYAEGTRPRVADTDGDGMRDGYEVDNGLDPLANDAAGDKDGDGLANGAEAARGTRADTFDTDGGGTGDGREVAHETDPLFAGDDFAAQIWTQDAANGTRGAPNHVTYVLLDDAFTYARAAGAFGGNVKYLPSGEAWLRVNGTNLMVNATSVVELVDFHGRLAIDEVGGQLRLSLDGHASRLILHDAHDDETEGALVHTHGRIATSPDGRTITVDLYHVVDGIEVAEIHDSYPILVGSPVPVFTFFDFWKHESDLSNLGTFRIRFVEGTYQGSSGVWAEIYNPDPTLINTFVPIVNKGVCVRTESPPLC